MIEEGDCIMVCFLGGKDSYIMLEILCNLQKSVFIFFLLVVVNFDQKQSGFLEYILLVYLEQLGVEYKIVEENIYGIVKEKILEGKIICLLCFCLCCGIFYCIVIEFGVIKIVFGYYCDDILQMLFLNMFYGGKMKGMLLKLMSDDGKYIVICLLVYCCEKDIECFFQVKGFLIILCNLCGLQLNLQCQVIVDMFCDWDKCYSGCIEIMFSVMQNVVFLYLSDVNLFDFKGIIYGLEVVDGGDLVFDWEDIFLQFVGWQLEEEDVCFDELCLNVVEVK